MCLTSWWNKLSTVLLSKCSWFQAKNIGQRFTSWKKLFDRKLIFSYEKRYTYCLSKKAKIGKCHRTTFYSVFNHVESSKYKMICLKSPKSSEFGKIINNVHFIILTTIQLNLKNREIKKIKSNASGRIRTRNPCVWG